MNRKNGSYSRSDDLYPKQRPIFDDDDLSEEERNENRIKENLSGNRNGKDDEQHLIEKDKSKFDRLKDLELDGFSALANATSICGATFWLCCLIIVLAFLTYEIYKTIDGYVNQPVLTTYTITKNDTMKLPYLLVCSGNFINESKLKTMSPRQVQAALSFQVSLVVDTGKKKSSRPKRSAIGFDGLENDDWGMNGAAFGLTDESENWQSRLLALVEEMGFDEDYISTRFKRDVNKTKQTTSDAQSRGNETAISYDEAYRAIMDLGFDSKQMFLECKFFDNGVYRKLPCASIVEDILDANYGKCYGITLPDGMVQGAESQGLSLTINTLDSKNSGNETAVKRYEGLLLSVDGSMNPVAWEKTLVGGGVYLNLDVSLEHLQLLNVKNGDPSQPCIDQDEAKLEIFNVSYGLTVCQLDCFVQQIVSTCHCLLNTEKRNIKTDYLEKYNFCTALDSTNCIVPNVTQDQDASDAVAACRSRCHVQCDSWRYKMNPTTTPLNPRAFDRFKPVPPGDILQLDLSYKSLEYKEFIQSYQITLDTFIGNLGGQITLWIGGSMITLLNVPIFLSNCICTRNVRKARKASYDRDRMNSNVLHFQNVIHSRAQSIVG